MRPETVGQNWGREEEGELQEQAPWSSLSPAMVCLGSAESSYNTKASVRRSVIHPLHDVHVIFFFFQKS